MKQLYFALSISDELCFDLDYWKLYIKESEISELKLHKAEKQDAEDYYWCREFGIPGERGVGTCGILCKGYMPRNGKSGCCKNYSLKFYQPSDKIKTLSNK